MPEYTDQGIEIIRNTRAVIRRAPSMYFHRGLPDNCDLVGHVARDAIGSGATSVTIRRADPFALVSADVDWMRTEHAPFKKLFHAIVAGTPSHRNLMRAEVLVAVAAEGFFSTGEIGDYAEGLSAADLPDDFPTPPPNAARVLCWKLANGPITGSKDVSVPPPF